MLLPPVLPGKMLTLDSPIPLFYTRITRPLRGRHVWRGRFCALGPLELLVIIFIVIVFAGLAVIMRVLPRANADYVDDARITRLERRVAQLEQHLGVSLGDGDVDESVRDLLRRGSKLEAIKAYRVFHPGTSLNEAMDAVDKIQRDLPHEESTERQRG